MLGSGHRESEILDYSVDKFNLYVGAASRKESRGRVDGIVDMSYTISGALSKSKALDTHLKALEENSNHGE